MKKISVPSDPRAAYFLVRAERGEDGTVEVLTRRLAPKGETGRRAVSFACRQIRPEAGMFRYLGEGDSRAEALGWKTPGPWGPLVEGSISHEVCRFACAECGVALAAVQGW